MKAHICGAVCCMVLLLANPRAAGCGVLRSAVTAPVQVTMLDTLSIPVSREDRVRLKRDLQMISRDEVVGEKRWQRKKNARVAVLSNAILPGLGQVYNGRRFKAAIMVGLSSFYMGEAWLNYKRAVFRKKERDRYEPNSTRWRFHDRWYDYHEETAKDFIWWSGAVWVIGMLDAYIDAHLFDLRGYVPESENRQASYLTLSLDF